MQVGNAFYPNNVTPPFNINTGESPSPKTKPRFSLEYKPLISSNSDQPRIFTKYFRQSMKWYRDHPNSRITDPANHIQKELLNEVDPSADSREFEIRYLGKETSTKENKDKYRMCLSREININVLKNCVRPVRNGDVEDKFKKIYGEGMLKYYNSVSTKTLNQTSNDKFFFKYKNVDFEVYRNGTVYCHIMRGLREDVIRDVWENLVTFCEKAGYHIITLEPSELARCMPREGGLNRTRTIQRHAKEENYNKGPLGPKNYLLPKPGGKKTKKTIGHQNPKIANIVSRFKNYMPDKLSNINSLIKEFSLNKVGVTKQKFEEQLKGPAPPQQGTAKSKNPEEWKGTPPKFNSNNWVKKNNKGKIIQILRPSNKADKLKYYKAPATPLLERGKLKELFEKFGKTPSGHVPTILQKFFGITNQKRNQQAVTANLKERANKEAAKKAAANATAAEKAKKNQERQAREAEAARRAALTENQRKNENRKRHAAAVQKSRDEKRRKELEREMKTKNEAKPLMSTKRPREEEAIQKLKTAVKTLRLDPETQARLDKLKEMRKTAAETAAREAAKRKERAETVRRTPPQNPPGQKPVYKRIMQTIKTNMMPFRSKVKPNVKNKRMQPGVNSPARKQPTPIPPPRQFTQEELNKMNKMITALNARRHNVTYNTLKEMTKGEGINTQGTFLSPKRKRSPTPNTSASPNA